MPGNTPNALPRVKRTSGENPLAFCARLCFNVGVPRYRPNVAFILRNAAGHILVCERSDWAGCWQFPQGGVKNGESLEEALYREVEEELGIRPADYRVLTSKGPYRYLFVNGRKKGEFEGQEQHYYLGELTRPDAAIRFDGSHEFRAARWLPPSSYNLEWIPPMKREVYAQVFQDFFDVNLREHTREFC